ncbi:MAG: peptide chain release factor aRF-1 [Candidatus Norongarragalinales archaeon]
MAEESKAQYEFKKKVKELKEYAGRGTELISVYVTPNYPLSEIAAKLRDEQGQASNIKSKNTRQNVVDALEKILQFLKGIKQTPPNGIAIFCGNVSRVEGKQDLRLFAVEPPVPLGVQFYRCESRFVVEPLEEMLGSAKAYGLVLIDGKDATIALLRGKNISIVKRLHSTAQQKVVKGGQSARRFQRIHEESVEAYYKRVGEAMNAFVGLKNFEGVIIGGPGPSKEDFLKLKPFNYQLRVLGVLDTGYSDEFGLRELLEKSGELIHEQEAVREKRVFDDFMREVSTGSGLAVYGFDEVKAMLAKRRVARLLVSEDLRLRRFAFKCSACGKEGERVAEEFEESACACGGKKEIIKEEDETQALLDEAERQGVPIEILARDTQAGSEFYATFRGLGAFLKYT